MNGNDMTKAWEYYELGRRYNNSLDPGLYKTVNANLAFYAGNQWLHIPESPAMSRLPRPVFNIIKRVTGMFVASLTSAATAISFSALPGHDGAGTENPAEEAAECATAEVRNLLEKFKLDYRIREALFDGACTGDYCAHFYWDPEALPYGGALGSARGEIRMELVDGVNVMFGNPNTTEVERQPYILVLGRESVAALQEEAQRYRRGSAPDIRADGERELQAGECTEYGETDGRTGKALYVYLYTKERNKDGSRTVHVTKATRSCNIFENIDTGLTRYPIAWGNWEKQKNCYHGRALVTGILPNQVFINSMMAMVFRHLQLQSFPKTLYNADLIAGWNNELGAAIGVRNLQAGMRMSEVAQMVRPADMSAQIIQAIDKVMEYTKECLGATDAQLGNVKADNTSAIMVLQNSAEIPLENTRAGLHEWVEDIGAILLDMMGTYYGRRPLVRERCIESPVTSADGSPVLDPVTGRMQTEKVIKRVTEEYDFSCFKELWLQVAADVGTSTYYSEIAMVQTLDNLRRDGTLDTIAYLERIPDKLIPRKAELLEELRARAGAEEAAETAGNAGALPVVGGETDKDKRFAALPAGLQGRFDALPAVAQRAVLNRKGE